MMLDMNGFKEINDNFGHSQGDDALVSMAKILEDAVGSRGVATRYAGDEFVIILNEDNEDAADACRKSILQKVEAFNQQGKKKYKLSVSIGVGIFEHGETSVDKILEIIDKRMYEDKKAYYEATGHDRRVHV